jgi:hypothetical protein
MTYVARDQRNEGLIVLSRVVRVCLYPLHLKRTLTISLAVGTWLTAVNQGDLLWLGQFPARIWPKVALNYLTPFVVANLGLLSSDAKEGGIR